MQKQVILLKGEKLFELRSNVLWRNLNISWKKFWFARSYTCFVNRLLHFDEIQIEKKSGHIFMIIDCFQVLVFGQSILKMLHDMFCC